MTTSPISSTASLSPAEHEEVRRRREAVEQALEGALSTDDMKEALLLCDDAFPPSQPFSASAYCQRLVAQFPHIDLTPISRLRLLRTMRQRVAEHGVDSRTKTMLLSPDLTQSKGSTQQSSEPVEPEPSPENLDATATATESSSSEPVTEPPSTSPLPQRQDTSPTISPTPINFIGNYWANLDDTPTGTIVVTELSKEDIVFKAELPHQIKEGANISILFDLNDQASHTIWQSVQIRSVAGDRIEGSWRNPDNLDVALQSYLKS